MHPRELTIGWKVSYPSQVTGVPAVILQDIEAPAATLWARNMGSGWHSDIHFSPHTGLAEVVAWHWIRAQNDTWFEVLMSLNMHTISDELADHLRAKPRDRLFIFFRQPHGHLLGASHGKFFSHSHIDLRQINPIQNPPQVLILFREEAGGGGGGGGGALFIRD